MKVTRRSFLKIFIGAGLLSLSGYILKTVLRPSSITLSETRTLEAYLDTLIPSDKTPGALQLGIPNRIIAKTETDRKYRRLIKKGCHWLDGKAKEYQTENFASLRYPDREKVIATASGKKWSSPPKIFFEQTRSDAFFFYYAEPESWVILGYKGPPQPYGFPDYISPPGRSST
jgi:hypothetical protein